MREWTAVFARRDGSFVPDAAASAVIMLSALAGTSLALDDSLLTSVDAFYRGLWRLLPSSMLMTLILVLSTVLSLTEAFRRAIRAHRGPAAVGDAGDRAALVGRRREHFHFREVTAARPDAGWRWPARRLGICAAGHLLLRILRGPEWRYS
ncbi:MAG: hypothetical protein IPF50_05050 [Proteobacteria bacterium]|nr:hypothetical protein [Pseudomonadota bacterium]